MLKGLKNKKDGKGDAKKDVKKEVVLSLCRNRPRKKERSRFRKRKKRPMMLLSRSISNFESIQRGKINHHNKKNQ